MISSDVVKEAVSQLHQLLQNDDSLKGAPRTVVDHVWRLLDSSLDDAKMLSVSNGIGGDLYSSGRCSETGSHNSMAESPDSLPLRRKRSVAFLNSESSPPGTAREEARGLLRSYSGFGSFRRQSSFVALENVNNLKQKALSFRADGMPQLSLNDSHTNLRGAFSRNLARHTEAIVEVCESQDSSLANTAGWLSDEGVEEDGSTQKFIKKALRVFDGYSFMSSFAVDMGLLHEFLDAVARHHVQANPFRSLAHTAETLAFVHDYFSQRGVANNFSDLELLCMLLASLCVNLGNLGVSNEFLANLNHPLVRIFSPAHTTESVSVMIMTQLLTRYPFLRDMPPIPAVMDIVTELVIGSAPRYHQAQLADLLLMRQRGTIRDPDVPTILTVILRAGMMAFCTLDSRQHTEWAQRWAFEAYRELDASKLLGFTESPATSSGVRSTLSCYVRDVAMPYFTALEGYLPQVIYDQSQEVAALYETDDFSFEFTVDPASLPPWSDYSSNGLELLGACLPREFVNTGHRMDHYLRLLKVFDDCFARKVPPPEFGGRLVAVAQSLDSAYLGEYAAVAIDEDDTSTFQDVAALIMDTEGSNNGETRAVSPTRRSQHTTDGFVIQLLSMYPRMFPASSQGRTTPSARGNPFRSRWELSTAGTIYSSPSH